MTHIAPDLHGITFTSEAEAEEFSARIDEARSRGTLPEFEVVYLDQRDEPLATCRVSAGDYLDACGIAWAISPQAHDFTVTELPV